MDEIELRIIQIVTLIFSVVVHEIAHAWVALRCGDTTARDLGRITLNPVPHIDLFMTIILPLALIMSNSPVVFGGAKPVPVNFRRCFNPRRAYWLVSLAGPLSNLALALCALILFPFAGLLFKANPAIAEHLFKALLVFGFINLILMTFNLLPIPPLDGSRILTVLLPDKIAWHYAQIERYGFFIIIGLLYLGRVNPKFNFLGMFFGHVYDVYSFAVTKLLPLFT